MIGTRRSIDCHSVSPQLWRRYFKRAASTWTACHLGSRRPWFRCPAYTGELLRFARQCSPMARHPASMSMKSILRRGGVLRDASGARQSTCRIRMWFDHHKLAGPSVYPVRVIEIIWQNLCRTLIVMSVMAISIARYASRNSPKARSRNT